MIIISISIIIIIIIIITYSSGLDTDVEKLYTISIVSITIWNFLLPLYIQAPYVRKRSSPISKKHVRYETWNVKSHAPTHIHSTNTYTVM